VILEGDHLPEKTTGVIEPSTKGTEKEAARGEFVGIRDKNCVRFSLTVQKNLCKLASGKGGARVSENIKKEISTNGGKGRKSGRPSGQFNENDMPKTATDVECP